MTDKIVKVRGRHGTKSLDITIPAELSEKYNINAGDLFKVKIKNDNDLITIEYHLIYKNQ
ncbi:MAG: AbrB/MazE/SpoVT family DNA-binding domain-containing protein [Methanosphaera sp.]|nr:AbrB/MazE/SpoVT family DNA-binding domain-containing protein [Methanosphaera sp.]